MANQTVIHTDIAIAGAGCGGTAAAIQAARLGATVVLVEETPWPGGMITSAGVTAFDGNHGPLTCGIFEEIVREVERHYGGPWNACTGWVTQTAFEPRVMAGIFSRMIAREELIQTFFRARVESVLRTGSRVTGFTFKSRTGQIHEVQARVTIDATEFGDLIALSGIDHHLGREARAATGEPHAPETGDSEIQDVTYVAILQDFQATCGRDAPLAPRSDDYKPEKFRGSTALDWSDGCDGVHAAHTWETFIEYGRLPRNKFMINWPFHANDFPDSLAAFSRSTRDEAFRRARAHTLDFVHYLQTHLGHRELGIADDEYPTADGLPFIPYVRESRRIVGAVRLREQDVVPADREGERPPLRRDSIACGDYFLDHHHASAHAGPGQRIMEDYPDNAPFQVPYGVFFPRDIEGFMAAEKNISVTHIVNGCTRLQPVVLLMGQACGAAAALAVRTGLEPRDLPVRDLQEFLILRRIVLYPYSDLSPQDRYFVDAQKLALAGVVPADEGSAFGAETPLTAALAAELIALARGDSALGAVRGNGHGEPLQELCAGMAGPPPCADGPIDRAQLSVMFCNALGVAPVPAQTIKFMDTPDGHWYAPWVEPLYRTGLYAGIWGAMFDAGRLVTRGQISVMLNRAFDPFRKLGQA